MAVSTLFTQQQLDYVMNLVLQQDFPERLMSSGALVPVSDEIDYRAETYSYRLLTHLGSAKIISAGAEDIPTVNAYIEKRMGFIRTLASSYEVTLEDLEAAQFANVNISGELGIATREVMEATTDTLGYTGDSVNNLQGFLNYPNVPVFSILNDGNINGGINSTLFYHKTSDQVYRDITTFITSMKTATRGIEVPEVLLLPQKQFDDISTRPYPSNTNSTLLEFLLRTQRATPNGIQAVVPVDYLAGQGVGGTDMMVLYRKRPDKIKYHIPLDFEQRPAQLMNFNQKVMCRMRLGGIVVMKPMCMRYAYGI